MGREIESRQNLGSFYCNKFSQKKNFSPKSSPFFNSETTVGGIFSERFIKRALTVNWPPLSLSANGFLFPNYCV
jgi:hypothetical protein